MSTGDLKNNVYRLLRILRQMQFTPLPHPTELAKADTTTLLKIMHFYFIEYSPRLLTHLSNLRYDLLARKDASFIQQCFKILINELGYKPPLKIEQFLGSGFVERKLLFMSDVGEIILRKDSDLSWSDGKKKKTVKKRIMVNNEPLKQQMPDSELFHLRPIQQTILERRKALSDFHSSIQKPQIDWEMNRLEDIKEKEEQKEMKEELKEFVDYEDQENNLQNVLEEDKENYYEEIPFTAKKVTFNRLSISEQEDVESECSEELFFAENVSIVSSAPSTPPPQKTPKFPLFQIKSVEQLDETSSKQELEQSELIIPLIEQIQQLTMTVGNMMQRLDRTEVALSKFLTAQEK